MFLNCGMLRDNNVSNQPNNRWCVVSNTWKKKKPWYQHRPSIFDSEFFNSFYATSLLLCPLKTSEKAWSCFSRGTDIYSFLSSNLSSCSKLPQPVICLAQILLGPFLNALPYLFQVCFIQAKTRNLKAIVQMMKRLPLRSLLLG